MAENGDVTYFRDRKKLLVDTGRKLFVVDVSDETTERALRLAAQKWGGEMNLAGTDEFIKQAIDAAARKNMQIEFVDPAHNEKLEDLKSKHG